MSDNRKHRGKHPEDEKLFAPGKIKLLQQAASDMSWLLGKGYKINSSLKLVGDRYRLTDRQRLAIGRSVCAPVIAENRQARRKNISECGGEIILIDGYNLIITLESALSGSYIFIGQDGCFRDLSGVHGSYRKVIETAESIGLIFSFLKEYDVKEISIYLDSPVSNSGRLKDYILEVAGNTGIPFSVELSQNPDAILKKSANNVVTSDGIILDAKVNWINLAAEIIIARIPEANLIRIR
jgi:hypothetical protein